MNCKMERILGVPIGLDKTIPGTVSVAGIEFVYFCDDGCSLVDEQFDALTQFATPPHAQCGGATLDGCSLTLPDGSVFHAIGYHGDLAGWRQDIEEGAAGLITALARIDAGKIVASDGRVFKLSECIPKFDWIDSQH